MTIAESDGMRLAYVAEAAEGTTPATPTFQTVRYTGESFKAAKNSIVSNEIRPDKNVSDIIAAGISVNGGFDGEFSYGTYDDLIAAVMRGNWASNVLVNGTDRHSFTFEKTAEQGTTDSFIRYRGVFVDSLTLSMQPRAAITASWQMLGMGADDGATTPITGATYTAATTTEIMPSGTFVGSITASGLTLPAIKSCDLTIASNLREQQQIASNDLAGVAMGQINVTGKLGLYFEDVSIYNKIRQHNSVALTINLGAVANEKYKIEIPKAYFMDGDPTGGGNGQDVAFDVGFQGVFDTSTGGTIKITRALP